MKRLASYLLIALLGCLAYGAILFNGAGFSGMDDQSASLMNSWNFRPLVMLTYQLNQHIGGWMLTNLILHLAAGCLLFLLSGSMFAASLFIVHPMATDAVASVAGRSSIVLAITVFMGIMLFQKFGKRMVIPCVALLLVTAGFTPRVWLIIPDAPGVLDHFVRFIAAIPVYIIPSLIVPIYLSPDPDIPYEFAAFLMGMTWVITLVFVFWYVQRKNVRLGIGLFLGSLLPYAFVPLPDVFLEHRGYLAIAGLTLILSEFLHRRLLLVAMGCFLILAHDRADVYSSKVKLWADAVQKSPNKARPHVNLGGSYAIQLNFPAAQREIQKGLAIDPKVDVAWSNLAITYMVSGDLANTSKVLDAWQALQTK